MTPRVAFVNGGILGLLSYATWVRRTFTDDRDIHAEHFVLSENLPLSERIVRRILCQRLWPDIPGSRNADLARFRQEWNAGLQARHRLLARGLEHFDVLHFHRQATAYASLDLMRRVPTIVSIDCTQTCMLQDTTSALERWSLGFNVRRDGEILERAAAIVSTSHWTERDVRQLYPGCRTPILVMPDPVTLDLFDPAWIDERKARANARPQCLFMGGDFPRKGGLELLDAWRRGGFSERADLTLVTEWPLRTPLPAGVRQVGGIRGQTPEWAAIWHAADLFVMPTRNDAFGLVYQEAAAAGLPAIGTRLNAVPEIIDERTGILVTPGHMDELVSALDRLISSAALREQMGRVARRKIEEDADSEAHRQRLVALITQVSGRHV
jgi:glycosyltransferase involved in cell wall biosynthesis